MDFEDDDRQAAAIAEEWGVDVALLNDTFWEIDTIDGNDGETYGYIVRFDEDTDEDVLRELGIPQGELERRLSLNAFDVPDYDEDDEPSVNIDGRRYSKSQIERLPTQQQIKLIVDWFHSLYEDPAVRTPFETAEGGYQWVWGGPYDAREEVGDNFWHVASQEIIDAAVTQITRDGLYDWAPKEKPEDYADLEEPDFTPPEGSLAGLAGSNFSTDNFSRFTFQATAHSSIKRPGTHEEFRVEVLAALAQADAALQRVDSGLPPRNHNNPPELVEPDALAPREIQITINIISEVRSEANRSEPSADALQAQASALRKTITKIARWLSEKMDRAVNRSIDRAVDGGILLGVGATVWLALSNSLQHVADSITAWATFISPPF